MYRCKHICFELHKVAFTHCWVQKCVTVKFIEQCKWMLHSGCYSQLKADSPHQLSWQSHSFMSLLQSWFVQINIYVIYFRYCTPVEQQLRMPSKKLHVLLVLIKKKKLEKRKWSTLGTELCVWLQLYYCSGNVWMALWFTTDMKLHDSIMLLEMFQNIRLIKD